MVKLRTASLTVVFLCAMQGQTACSGESGGAKATPEDTKAFRTLFSAAFRDAGEDPYKDIRLAYKHSSVIRNTMQSRVADSVGDFGLAFAMPDAAEFVRSGGAAATADRKLAALSLPQDTLAGATVLMFGLAWELANRQSLTAADQRALLKQVDTQLVKSPLRTRGDTARQREADMRLLIAGVWLEEARLRQGRPDQMQALSDAVHEHMLRMGGDNDMRAHRIGADGLESR